TDLETQSRELSETDRQRLDALNLDMDVATLEDALRTYESQPWKNALSPEARTRQQRLGFRYVLNAFAIVLTAARTERLVQLRKQWPDLARLCVDGVDLIKSDLDDAQGAVIQHALINRFDLMNVRAQLVDAWRQLAVFANALLGTFNVQYHLDSTTPAGRGLPFAFAGSRTTNQLIMNFELPLVRTTERNNYRASLIAFQRQRRALQEAEDLVVQGVRGEIRQLRVLAENYRIQQRQVELAYLTVESSLDTFQAPPAPG